MGLRVQVSGFGVVGFGGSPGDPASPTGFGVWGFGVYTGFRVWGSVTQGLGFRYTGFGVPLHRVSGLGVRLGTRPVPHGEAPCGGEASLIRLLGTTARAHNL